jgi:hypothetical protein
MSESEEELLQKKIFEVEMKRRKKLSETMKAKWQDKEYYNKTKSAMKGKKRSEETKEKMRQFWIRWRIERVCGRGHADD